MLSENVSPLASPPSHFTFIPMGKLVLNYLRSSERVRRIKGDRTTLVLFLVPTDSDCPKYAQTSIIFG